MQETAKKCTKCETHAEALFCSLHLSFCAILTPIVVVKLPNVVCCTEISQFISQSVELNYFYLSGRRHTLDLAASALAGLASTEDFTKVRLRKTAGPDEKDEFRGTKPIMLIHIKGD